MADKTGSTGDSSGLPPSCGSMLFVKPVASRIRPRLVSPIWPWTMSSIKVFIRKLVGLPMRGGSCICSRSGIGWKRQSQQIDDFCAQKVNVIVINPVKGDSQPILRALKKLENKELRSLQLIPSSSILSRMPALSPTTTKQESWLRKSWWNALQMLGSFSWSTKGLFRQIRGFRDLRIPSKDMDLMRSSRN